MKGINYFLILSLLGVQSGFCAPTADIIMAPEGKVEARSGSSAAWITVESNVRITQGAEIRTGKNSKAAVHLSDGSRFMLGNNTLFTVDTATKKKAGFQLKFGRLKAAVAGYFSSRFEVKTPSAVCAVRGTEFELEVAENGGTDMNVSEGLVEVNDSRGAMAVISSEERIKIGMDGMARPETIPLNDEHAGEAARPMAVRQESARENTRTMMEELRNRELKANEAQLGKDSIDAFGKRVRIEEYLLRPSNKEFQILFLSRRAEEKRLDWGRLTERFNSKIPDDLSQVGRIVSGMYFSKTKPKNWMTYFEVYLTNTVDSIKETIAFGSPVLVNFSGYGALIGSRYYPASMDYKQILSGPGVALTAGAGSLTNTGLTSLRADERMQFRQIQNFNSTTASKFTWTQYVVNASGVLAPMYRLTLDPTNATEIAGLDADGPGTATYYNSAIDVTTTVRYPSGVGKADYLVSTLYADGSTVSSRKLLVSNEGEILGVPSKADSSTFLKEGSFNLETVVGSSLFQGRKIDVLLAPEILSQKKGGTPDVGSLDVK